jgi:hypothetical protein
MVDLRPQFEIYDLEGSTKTFSGSAISTPTQVPSVPTFAISEALIRNDGAHTLEVSFDLGSTYFKVAKGDVLIWGPKGGVTYLLLKSSSGSVPFEILMNLESS